MKMVCNARNWNGLAALACLLLIPGLAKAACLNTSPSFTYATAVSSGAQSTIEVSAPAGCFWEVVSQPDWIKIVSLNRGFGSGSIVFQVLPGKKNTPGFLRLVVRDLDRRRANIVDLPIRANELTGVLAADHRTTAGRSPER